jgi:hypothetical protein
VETVTRQVLAVLEGYLQALGEARFLLDLNLEEIRRVYQPPAVHAAAVARGDTTLELSTSIPEPDLTWLADGTAVVQYPGDRQRYLLTDEEGIWRIQAIQRADPRCGDPQCDSCEWQWIDYFPETTSTGGAPG